MSYLDGLVRNPESLAARLGEIKQLNRVKFGDAEAIRHAIDMIQDQHKTILRQRKQLADLQKKK
jgi:hypothetical protein